VAAWAAWRWRARLSEPALALPALSVLAFTVQALIATDGTEGLLLPACAPMAMLAGVGLPTLRRGIVNLIDWFAVTSFTIFGIAIWAWWIALMTGVPPRMAYRAAQIAPGFEPSWIIVEIVLGGLATIAWLMLVRWRIARRPRMIWRAMALSGGGLVLAWFLLMTLWLPVFNERNTYRDLALGLRDTLASAPQDCVSTRGLGPAQRASFMYFASPRFEPPADSLRRTTQDSDARCGWLLVQDTGERKAALLAPRPGLEPVWQGQRRPNRAERFVLFRLEGAPSGAARRP
jgi:4-amino-4-deoxy-L-arabinose transferase-like glycosyltransferase